jgi:hypothetical protein
VIFNTRKVDLMAVRSAQLFAGLELAPSDNLP